MIFHLLSDTHGHHNYFTMPGGDFLLHSGDMTGRGTPETIQAVLDWLEIQPYTHKIVIPGNHDFDFEKNPDFWKAKFEAKGIHLLNDSGVELEGIKFWGSPITPWFHNWAFNRWSDQIKKHWDMIPKDTQVLLTHGPPWGVLDTVLLRDEHVGCPKLLDKINRMPDLKLHQFGHIHEGAGHVRQGDLLYVNASSLNECYKPTTRYPVMLEMDEKGRFSVI